MAASVVMGGLSIMSRVFQILLLGLSAVRAAPHDEATPALRGARALKFGHYVSDPAETYVTGSMELNGMSVEDAQANEAVFVSAIAASAGVSESTVAVSIAEARRRRLLAGGIQVRFQIKVVDDEPSAAETVIDSMSALTSSAFDSALATAATALDVEVVFASIATMSICCVTETDIVEDPADAVDDASSKGDDGDYGVDNSATAAPTNSFEYVDDAGGKGDDAGVDDWWDAY